MKLKDIKDFLPITAIILVATLTYKWWGPWLANPNRGTSISSRPQVEEKRRSHPSPNASQSTIPEPTGTIPPDDLPYLQNHELTPGSVFPNATREVICVKGYTKQVRHVSGETKQERYRAYGIPHHRPGDYEMDHLISLELGGNNEPANLWPELYHGQNNAHVKDKLENELHRLVCNGTIPLEQAQREIATDWLAAYRKYVGQETAAKPQADDDDK